MAARVIHFGEDLCHRIPLLRRAGFKPVRCRSLGELRTLLSARVKKAVSHEVAKDLTASSPTALRKALANALPEAAT